MLVYYHWKRATSFILLRLFRHIMNLFHTKISIFQQSSGCLNNTCFFLGPIDTLLAFSWYLVHLNQNQGMSRYYRHRINTFFSEHFYTCPSYENGSYFDKYFENQFLKFSLLLLILGLAGAGSQHSDARSTLKRQSTGRDSLQSKNCWLC